MKTPLRILVLAASLAVAAPLYAQGGGGGGGRGGTPEEQLARQKEPLFKGITLTPAQSAQADTIIMTFMTKQREMMQAARAGGGGDMAAMAEQRTKMITERNDKLKALLDDAGKAKFDENFKAIPQGRGRGGF